MKSISTIILILFFSSVASAECPVDASDALKIQSAIENSSTCYDAANIAEQCAWGSSVDVGFTDAAREICDKSRPELSSMEQAVYDGLVNQCLAKYENEQGTMYRSAAAFCALGVAQTFSSVFSPVGF